MNKINSRIIIFLFIFSLIISTSCSNEKNREKINYENKESGAESSTENKEPITFTIFSADNNPKWRDGENPLGKELERRTGVKVDYVFADGDPNQEVLLMISSGEYPDMVYAKGVTPKLIKANAILKLDELIDKEGSNIKKMYGKYYDRLRYSNEDPSIYYVGGFAVGEENFDTSSSFWLQHNVVMEQNFPKLRTLKDYENSILEYKKNHPTIDGKKTIGISLVADDWRFMITVTNPAAFATGKPDDGEWFINPNTYEAELHYSREEEKEYFRWLNHIYNIGLLDPDSLLQKHEVYIEKLSQGNVLGVIDSDWDFIEARQNLFNAGMEEYSYGSYPITIDEKYKYASMQRAGYSGSWGICITKDCKYPERAIQFLDYICSDKGQILMQWGPEGILYNNVDGKRVINPEMMNKRLNSPDFESETGIGSYSYPLPSYGRGVKDPTGQYYSPDTKEQIIENYTSIEKKVLAGYNAKLWSDLFPKPDEFKEKDWGHAWQVNVSVAETEKLLHACQDIANKRIVDMILAKPEYFDGIWDKYISELNSAGKEKLEESFTKLLKDRISLWNISN